MRRFMKIVEGMQYEMFPPNSLYHTTSPGAAFDILSSHTVRPSNNEGFCSFSLKPHLHDIAAHGAVIVFDLRQLYAQLEPVEYTQEWAHEHPDQARYIAGEGWAEQFQYEPDDTEEDDFEDDGYETAYAEAELEAFLHKSDEEEWISLQAGQAVHFTPAAVTSLIVHEIDAETEADLKQIGYGHVKLLTVP